MLASSPCRPPLPPLPPASIPSKCKETLHCGRQGLTRPEETFGCPKPSKRGPLWDFISSFYSSGIESIAKQFSTPHSLVCTQRQRQRKKKAKRMRETSKLRHLRCAAGHGIKVRIPSQHAQWLMKSTTIDLHAALHTGPGESWTVGRRLHLLPRLGSFPSRRIF